MVGLFINQISFRLTRFFGRSMRAFVTIASVGLRSRSKTRARWSQPSFGGRSGLQSMPRTRCVLVEVVNGFKFNF